MADFICQECGHEYDELGNGKCYACGGNIIPIEDVGVEEEEKEYPEHLMEKEAEEEGVLPEESIEEPYESKPLEEGREEKLPEEELEEEI